MLYDAAVVDTPNHHGAILTLEGSVFAPSPTLALEWRAGSADPAACAKRYLAELRTLQERDPQPFVEWSAFARQDGPHITIVDNWGDVPTAPRRLLAGVLLVTAACQTGQALHASLKQAP